MDYIKNIQKLLNSMQIVQSHYSESTIIFSEDNSKIVTIQTSSKNDSLRLGNNFERMMTLFPLFFYCLDSYIDEKNPSLVGRTFNFKYKNMNVTRDADKILKEIYRIVIIIRNVTSHNINSCIFEDAIKIDYMFSGTNFKLKMSSNGMKLIFGFVLTVMMEDEFCSLKNDKYRAGVFLGYCNKIMNEISEFTDDKSDVTLPTINAISFSRDIILDSQYSIVENDIEFNYQYDRTRCVNFYFKYNGKDYMLPKEELSMDMKISVDSISSWSVLC